jgi:hypothetical protein
MEYDWQEKEGKEGAQGLPSSGARASEGGERVGGKGTTNARKRKEAVLIKVEEGRDWIEIYRRIMAARNTIEGATGMRKIRAGHILIEFDRKIVVSEVAEKLKTVLCDATELAALVSRATVRIKNIDPLTTKEELAEDMRREWGIKKGESVEVRALKMALWGTQVAVVVLPASAVSREESTRRFRTGLIIASVRLLSNMQRCFKCHMIRHMAARCTVLCPGKELCRRCGSNKHMMRECTLFWTMPAGISPLWSRCATRRRGLWESLGACCRMLTDPPAP